METQVAQKRRTDSDLATRTRRNNGRLRRHKLPVCDATGLARYRDRHQARDGAKSLSSGERRYETSVFACADCRGFHLEKTYLRTPIIVAEPSAPTPAFIKSLFTRKRCYWIIDIENPTSGAKWSPLHVAEFFGLLKTQAPGITSEDHVVVAAARSVRRKYRHAIVGPNVKWVTGADAPDGADRAALHAIDLHRVARSFDELVIVSGDHAFAELGRQAKKFGITVRVVTVQNPKGRATLSRELAEVADVRTFVRLESRTNQPVTVEKGSIRTHRRIHVETIAA